MGSREDGLKADAVATAFPKILSSLVGDSLGHRHGADPPGLQRKRVTSRVNQQRTDPESTHQQTSEGFL